MLTGASNREHIATRFRFDKLFTCRSDGLDVTAPPFVLPSVEEFPLGLDSAIAFQLGIRFCPRYVVTYVDFIEFVH